VEGIEQPVVIISQEPATDTAQGVGNSNDTTTLTVTGLTGIIRPGALVSGASVQPDVTIVSQLSGIPGGEGDYLTSAPTTIANESIDFTTGINLAFFPSFAPVVPPPTFGEGGGVPPEFPPLPPDTAPVSIPPGVLVGPVVAPAAVPPSVAGFPQPTFWPPTSATSPTATSWFPDVTVQLPPGQPIFVKNDVMMIGNMKPPSTPTFTQVPIGGWGEPGPQEPEPPLGRGARADQLPTPEPEPRRRRRKPV